MPDARDGVELVSPRNLTAVVFGILGVYFTFRSGFVVMFAVAHWGGTQFETFRGLFRSPQLLLEGPWLTAARFGSAVRSHSQAITRFDRPNVSRKKD